MNRRTKKGDQWVDDASFFDCTLFGKSAESLNPYLTKGQQGGNQRQSGAGALGEDGQNRSKVGIIANSLTLLGSQARGPESKHECSKEQSFTETCCKQPRANVWRA